MNNSSEEETASDKDRDHAFFEFWKDNWPGLCPSQIALACWRESARQALEGK